MLSFTIAVAVMGLFVGSVLASWIDRLPYEDIETSMRVPSLINRPFQWMRTRARRLCSRSGHARALSSAGTLRRKPVRAARRVGPRDPWLTRRQRYLDRNRFMEEDYQRLEWYKRLPIIGLLFDSSPVALRWFDKLPLIPYFVYAVKFSNYRALRPWAACPHCSRTYGFAEHLPLVLLFKSGNRCTGCGAKQSWQRALVEIATAALFGLFAARFGPTWLLAGYLVLLAAFVVCAVVDWQFQIIPDEINTGGLALGFAYCAITHSAFASGLLDDARLERWLPPDYDRWYGYITIWDSMLGFLAGGGALLALGRIGTWIAGTDALGGGDIKLAGFIGAFLGWRFVLVSLFYSALVGAVAGGIVLYAGRGQKEHGYTKFAFGPYICLGTLLVMYFGAETMFYSYMGFNNWLTTSIAQWLYPSNF